MKNLQSILFVFSLLTICFSCSDNNKKNETPKPVSYAQLQSAELILNDFSEMQIESNPRLVFESQEDRFDDGNAVLILQRSEQRIPFQYDNSVEGKLTLTIDKEKLPQGFDIFDGIIEIDAGKSGEFKLETVKFHVPFQAAETEGKGELK